MTMEEAIARLEANRGAFVFKETNEALDMAIEALSADAVSREDGIPCPICNGIGVIKRSLDVNANMVEVVRCKDCRWRKEEYCGFLRFFDGGEMIVKDDGFCSYGERREAEDE